MTEPNSSKRDLLRGTGVVAGLTMVSRILGFVRDLLVARLFGTSALSDAFFVAFRIPNLLRSFVAEGALTAAFVPVFTQELSKGKNEAQQALSSVLGLVMLVTGLMSVAGIIFAEEIVTAFAPGFGADSETTEICILLTQIMFPFIFCISLVATLNGTLNAARVYGVAAFAQVIINIFLITGALLAGLVSPKLGAVVLAVSLVVGGVGGVVAQLGALRRTGFRFHPQFKLRTPAIGELLKLMAPALVGAAVYQVAIFLNTFLASFLTTGSVSWLFYADRLTQLPIGVFSIALASVLLPNLSRAQASNNSALFGESLVDSLRFTSVCILPLLAALFFFAEPLVALLFQRGAFNETATAMTALAVRGLVLGLWAASCHSMLVRACLAQKDTVTPTCIGILSLLTTAVVSIACMGTLATAEPSAARNYILTLQNLLGTVGLTTNFAHVGLTLGSCAGALVSLLAVWIVVARRNRSINFTPFVRSTWQAFASCGLAGVAIWSFLPHASPSAQLFFYGPLFLLSYGFVMWVLRNDEVKQIAQLVRRKLFSSKDR